MIPLLSPKSIVKPRGPFQAAFQCTVSSFLDITIEPYTFKINALCTYDSIPVTPLEAKMPLIKTTLTQEEIDNYYHCQNLVSQCGAFAERINAQLRDLLSNYYMKIGHSKDEIIAADFMKLRDILSDFIKSENGLKLNELFNTKSKIKAITSTFFRYITD